MQGFPRRNIYEETEPHARRALLRGEPLCRPDGTRRDRRHQLRHRLRSRGGLYVSEPTTDATKVFSDEKARRVRLGLLRDVDGADFVEALEEGLNANLTPEKKAAIEKEVATLKTVMQTIGDVVEGDLIDFDYVPEKGTVILRNGKPVAEPIPGKALYDAVLAIWLGDKPIDDTLKTGMLGL